MIAASPTALPSSSPSSSPSHLRSSTASNNRRLLRCGVGAIHLGIKKFGNNKESVVTTSRRVVAVESRVAVAVAAAPRGSVRCFLGGNEKSSSRAAPRRVHRRQDPSVSSAARGLVSSSSTSPAWSRRRASTFHRRRGGAQLMSMSTEAVGVTAAALTPLLGAVGLFIWWGGGK